MDFTDNFKKKVIIVIAVAIIYALLSFIPSIIIGDHGYDVVDAFPVLFGFMFGSSGAVGSAIGDLISHLLAGDFSLVTLASFAGTFALAYAPYKVWAVFLKKENENIFLVKKLGDVLAYVIVGIAGSVMKAVTVCVGKDLAEVSVYVATFPWELLTIATSVLTVGLVLYIILSAFNMFGLAKAVKKYPIKTQLHMITFTIDALIIIIIGAIGYYFTDQTQIHNLWILIPTCIFGFFMYLDLMYGASPDIIKK